MRKKIQELAYARFRTGKPELSFEEERLELTVLEDETYVGSFSIYSANEIPMKGLVYSSNPRMRCQITEFEGAKVTVPYEFHSEGLVEGDVQKGEFCLVCEGGEYSLSFVVSITRFYARTSLGKIRNLFEFANLAQVSWTEAYHMFQAPFFLNIIREGEQRERLLYQALGGSEASQQDMEEFLIGIRKKQPVEFLLIQSAMELEQVQCESMETISLRKSQWGYLSVSMTSDHPAVVPVKGRITTEDFVGNLAEAGFLIHPGELHPGKNYIRLTFSSLRQKAVCELCIYQKAAAIPGGKAASEGHKPAAIPGGKAAHEGHKLRVRLAELYLDFRMQRSVTGVWAKESVACLERFRQLEPDNLWYVLYQAQALIINKQRQEAEWRLDHFRRLCFDKESPLYGYYLYITTIQEREPSYVAKAFLQIREIYYRNQENLWLFLMILFLDPQMNQSDNRKYRTIEEKVREGMNSPILYMEAFRLVKKEPLLLRRAGTFERRILYWAVRQQALTPQLARQVLELMPLVKKYHPMWYRILQECYRLDDSTEALKAVCGFCVKWNLAGEEQFAWFDRGVKEELRIAGLYEAWISCGDMQKIGQFPQAVTLYFQYQNTLNYKKQAVLYRCIVQKKEKEKDQYLACRDRIRQFALEQLLEGHMDENLAVLYEDVLDYMYINETMARKLEEILFVHRISCEDGRAQRLVVLTAELKGEQAVPLTAQQGYAVLPSTNYVILAEDEQGNRYIPGEVLELFRLMSSGRYLKRCMQVDEFGRNFLIACLEGRKTWHTYQEEDLARWLCLIDDESVSESCRRELKLQMTEYYYNSYTGQGMDEYLSRVDYHGMPRGPRNKLLELLIARGVYERAYEMLMNYGSEQASLSKLMVIAAQKMTEIDYGKDPFLVGLCQAIFRRGKYNEHILHYLLLHQQGNIRQMEQLWKAAREFDMDTYDLEERFLTQLLYTEGYTQQMEDIFCSYFEHQGNEMLIMAYLTCSSHQYVVQQAMMGDPVFACIQQQLELGNPLNDSCRLACFQWLAGYRGRNQGQEELLEKLLKEYLEEKRFFAFYHGLPRELLRKYRLTDRFILEYRTLPGSQVYVDYACEKPGAGSAYVEEPLKEMYEGIYGKSFVVFFGEEIPYYIREDNQEGARITQSGHITTHEMMEQGEDSLYGLLNDMMISYHLNDTVTLGQLYGQYQEKCRRVKEHFVPL